MTLKLCDVERDQKFIIHPERTWTRMVANQRGYCDVCEREEDTIRIVEIEKPPRGNT